MVPPHLRINVVVGAHRVVADVRGIRTVHKVGSPRLVDALVERIGSGVGMIGTIASVRHQVPVMLERVKMVIGNDALNFVGHLRLMYQITAVAPTRAVIERGLRLTQQRFSLLAGADFRWLAQFEQQE